MPAIAVIADDLSGAAEIAGIARSCGLSAEVQRGYQGPSPADVVAIDTDSRCLPGALAAARVRSITQQAVADRPDWIFKKVDSVLRGNVRAEIEAVLAAAGLPQALLIPCNPSRGRCIVLGRYIIDGVPLDQTPFAADPDHPRTTADVASQLAPGGHYPLVCRGQDAPLAEHGITVPDAASLDDLVRRVGEAGERTLVAGAADLFHAVLKVRCAASEVSVTADFLSLSPPVLLVCGSRVAWLVRRQECAAAGFVVATIDQPLPTGVFCPALLLGIADEVLPDRAASVSRLADRAADVVRLKRPRAVLTEGGATAAALAARLEWKRFDVAAPSPNGVGVLRPQNADAPLFVIKPGSYPWPASIWNAVLSARQRDGV